MSKSVAMLLMILFLIASCVITVKPAFSSVDVAENSWVPKAPMHEARSGIGAAVVNGKIYAIGGSTANGEWRILGLREPSGGVVGTNEEYDPTKDSWMTKSPMPTPRIGFTIAGCQNKIYFLGGATTNPKVGIPNYVKAVEVYDPATNKWQTKTPMTAHRENFAIAVYDNKIFCIGGTTGVRGYTYRDTALNEVYDPITDTWENKSSMPTAMTAAAYVVNSKIYLIGSVSNGTLIQVYDPATDTWAMGSSLPTSVYGATALFDGKIYVIGSSPSTSYVNQIYDVEGDRWVSGAPPPSDSGTIDAIFVTSGEMAPQRFYILDTRFRIYDPATDSSTLGPGFRIYDPVTDSWALGSVVPTSRVNLRFVLAEDKIYAIGGNTYTEEFLFASPQGGTITPFATNEEYTPLGYGTVPPVIGVVTGLNATYNSSAVPLAFTLNRLASWIGYSLDGGVNVTTTGNTTLTGLANGLHHVVVYANDTIGNMGKSEIISFTVAAPEIFPTVPVAVVSIASVSVAFIGLFIYFRKKHERDKKILPTPDRRTDFA